MNVSTVVLSHTTDDGSILDPELSAGIDVATIAGGIAVQDRAAQNLDVGVGDFTAHCTATVSGL